MSKPKARKKDKALTLFEKGRYIEAKGLYLKRVRQQPADAEGHYMLGVVQGHLGDYPEAIRSFIRALDLYPASAMANCGLGMAHRAMGHLREAEQSFRRALQRQPGFADAELELANTYSLLGERTKALELYHKIVHDNPGYYKAVLARGALLELDGKFNEAIATYRDSLESMHGIPELHTRLASCLHALGQLDQAESEISIARKLRPRSPEILYEQAKIKVYLGKLDEAMACYRAIGASNPGDKDTTTGATVGEALIQERMGNKERVIELIHPLIDNRVENAALGTLYLQFCRDMDACDSARQYCIDLLEKESLSTEDRMLLEYRMGKHYDHAGDYDTAFLHFERANKLGHVRYDPAEDADKVDSIISTFSPAFFMAAPRATLKTDKPVFIVGIPRSGTSLIEQIIASHPRAFGAGELTRIGELVTGMCTRLRSNQPYPACLSSLDQKTLDDLAGDYLGYIENLDGKADKICDKMPHNFVHLGVINLLFPDARVIHCKRNPMDTCLSIYTQHFNESHAYGRDLYHLGKHYMNYERLMTHWQSTLDIKILNVQYEDVVDNIENMGRKLTAFCGLEWDNRCLEFYKARRVVATASYNQVNKPIYTSSVGRWERYKQHLRPLLQALEE